MKRSISVALTAVLCFGALTACSAAGDAAPAVSEITAPDTTASETDKTETGEAAQISNPWTDCGSLAELNAAAGTALHAPTDLDVTDTYYSYMSGDGYTLAQYGFTYNGGEYTLRTAPTQSDISGVYQDGKTLTELAEDDNDILTTDENALWSRWFDGSTQFSLYATNASAEDFTAVRTALQ